MQARRPLGFRLASIVLTAAALGCQPETAESIGKSEEELVVNPCTTAWVRSVAPANAGAFLDVAEQWVNYQDIPGHEPSTGVRYCTPTICGGTADCCRADVDFSSDACFPSTFNGYRRDCSGFVSNVWGLQTPGRITSGLAPYNNDVSSEITWDQLVVGDAINMLFAGWYDAAHTQFCAYEESACGLPNYLRLKYKANHAGWFPIRKTGWTPTPPATCSNAGPFSGSGSNGNSGASCVASYNFNVVQGQTYTISTCGSFSGDPYLVVSGACSCRNDDSCGLGSQCTCTASTTGTAYVCASSYSTACALWNYQVTCGSSPPPPSCTPNRSCVGRECAGCGIPDGCGGTFCCTQTGQEAWGCGNLHAGVCWSDGTCYCGCGIFRHAAHEGASCSGSCANTSCTCP